MPDIFNEITDSNKATILTKIEAQQDELQGRLRGVRKQLLFSLETEQKQMGFLMAAKRLNDAVERIKPGASDLEKQYIYNLLNDQQTAPKANSIDTEKAQHIGQLIAKLTYYKKLVQAEDSAAQILNAQIAALKNLMTFCIRLPAESQLSAYIPDENQIKIPELKIIVENFISKAEHEDQSNSLINKQSLTSYSPIKEALKNSFNDPKARLLVGDILTILAANNIKINTKEETNKTMPETERNLQASPRELEAYIAQLKNNHVESISYLAGKNAIHSIVAAAMQDNTLRQSIRTMLPENAHEKSSQPGKVLERVEAIIARYAASFRITLKQLRDFLYKDKSATTPEEETKSATLFANPDKNSARLSPAKQTAEETASKNPSDPRIPFYTSRPRR